MTNMLGAKLVKLDLWQNCCQFNDKKDVQDRIDRVVNILNIQWMTYAALHLNDETKCMFTRPVMLQKSGIFCAHNVCSDITLWPLDDLRKAWLTA